MKIPLERWGHNVLGVVEYLGSLVSLSWNAFRGMFGRKRWRVQVPKYIEEIGVNSLPLAGVISLFTGMVLVMETVYALKKFGAEMYAGGLVSVSMIRELGPVLIALIVSGRVGAAIAAEIGTMKITEQLDALEVLAVDPVVYLASPRLLAGLIAMPVLFMLAFFLAIAGGFLVGVNIVGISGVLYWNQSFRFLVLKDLLVGLLKILIFIVIIVDVSCHEGFRARGGAEGVGRAATSAVVISFFLIILANLIVTAVFYFL